MSSVRSSKKSSKRSSKHSKKSDRKEAKGPKILVDVNEGIFIPEDFNDDEDDILS